MSERTDLIAFMHQNFRRNVPLEILARESGRSLSTFNREFRLLFDETPHKWIMRKRLEYAWELLKKGDQKVTEVYLEAGFQDLSHFSKRFKQQFGINPSLISRLQSEGEGQDE